MHRLEWATCNMERVVVQLPLPVSWCPLSAGGAAGSSDGLIPGRQCLEVPTCRLHPPASPSQVKGQQTPKSQYSPSTAPKSPHSKPNGEWLLQGTPGPAAARLRLR